MNDGPPRVAEPGREPRIPEKPGFISEVAEYPVEGNDVTPRRARLQQHLRTGIEKLCPLNRPRAAEIGLQVAVARAAEAGAGHAWRRLDEIKAISHAESAFDLQDESDRS